MHSFIFKITFYCFNCHEREVYATKYFTLYILTFRSFIYCIYIICSYKNHKVNFEEVPKERPIKLPCKVSGCKCASFHFVPPLNCCSPIRCHCKHTPDEHSEFGKYICKRGNEYLYVLLLIYIVYWKKIMSGNTFDVEFLKSISCTICVMVWSCVYSLTDFL
jgi:hypothetical protein